MRMKRNIVAVVMLCCLSACLTTTPYQVENKQAVFDPALIITEPTIVEGRRHSHMKGVSSGAAKSFIRGDVVEAFMDSGYIENLYEKGAMYSSDAVITLKAVLHREDNSNFAQHLTKVGTLVTLGAAPSHVTKKYTLHVKVYKNGKFFKSYESAMDQNSASALFYQSVPDEKSIVKALIPDFLRQFKQDKKAIWVKEKTEESQKGKIPTHPRLNKDEQMIEQLQQERNLKHAK